MTKILGGVEPQEFISDRVPMPVDIIGDTSFVNDIAGEVVQLYYWNAGVLTIDAGQPIGTVVVAKLKYTGILDKLGGMVGNDDDTSLVWSTGTVLPAVSMKPGCKFHIESPDNKTLEQIALDLTSLFVAGEWCLDHRTGLLFGKKATNGVSDTAAYKVMTTVTGGGGGPTADVNIAKVGGTNTAIDDSSMAATPPFVPVGGEYRLAATTYADGDATVLQTDVNGKLRVAIDSDIEIGAVEIKNSTTDDRVIVKTASTFATSDLTMGVTDPYNIAIASATSVPTTLTSGNKTVAVSGTAEALGAALATKSIYIRAKGTNTGNVFIGDSTVDAVTNKGIILAANDSVTLDIANRSTVYVDVAVNLEGVDYVTMS